MKKLFEVVAERAEKVSELCRLKSDFVRAEKKLLAEIEELSKLENVAQGGFDVIKIQLAESVLDVRGNPYGRTDQGGATIAEQAIVAIAEGSDYLRRNYFGNKRYEGFYQGSNHPYGFGPKHGGVCDEVGLKREARERDLTDDEKDACIYYLKNYAAIKASKTKV